MKLLFLRGAVPNDRDPREIMWHTLDKSNDVWEHLAAALGDEECEIVYWGGKRVQGYSDKCIVRWVPKLKNYTPDFTPDVIFERGGFEEGRAFVKRYPNVFRIYYGSGARFEPRNRNVKYDLVLVDSERQLRKARKHGWNAQLWQKPAAPQFRYMPEVVKEYDVVYVADGRFPFRAKIKNVDWFYRTAPKDLKILHLGWSGDRKVPKNITVKRVQRSEMPLWYNRCKVGIVPYTDYDSSPRVIPEMMACGLPIVISDEVHQNYKIGFPLDKLWNPVRYELVSQCPQCGNMPLRPGGLPTIQTAAEQIKGYIDAARNLPA